MPHDDFRIVQPKNIEESSDPFRTVDVTAVEGEKIDRENERWEELKQDIRQDRDERKRYANRIYTLVCCWLASVLVVVLLQAVGHGWFSLPEIVLTTLIGGTTTSVLGLFWVVSRYLFPDRSSQRSSSD